MENSKAMSLKLKLLLTEDDFKNKLSTSDKKDEYKNQYRYYKNYYTNYKKKFPTDSGTDLMSPFTLTIPKRSYGNKIDLGIACEPVFDSAHGYYLYPRSSVSDTPLRLANSVGIFDYTYRGSVIARVDNTSDQDFVIVAGTRYFQLCAYDLSPLNFVVVSELNDTARGTGAFGSTGK